MVARLGTQCRRARLQADLRAIDIASSAGVSEAVISRFERGERWPKQLDEIVAAYERECGLPRLEIWRRAIDV